MTKKELPEILTSLVFFLKNTHAFVLEERNESEDFADMFLILRGEQLRVKLLRDRGDWFIQISSQDKPDEWYEIGLIKESINGGAEKNILSIDEQVAYLQQSWQIISTLFNAENAMKMHAALKQHRLERAKRIFSDWFEKS